MREPRVGKEQSTESGFAGINADSFESGCIGSSSMCAPGITVVLVADIAIAGLGLGTKRNAKTSDAIPTDVISSSDTIDFFILGYNLRQ